MARARDTALLGSIGRRFQEVRQARRWTQEQLAEALGVQPLTLSRWERGERAISISLLAKAAQQLGVGLGDLLDVERELPPAEHSPDAAHALRLFDQLPPDRRDLALRVLREMTR